MQRLVEAVKNAQRDGPGAVACSGGPDSVALSLAFVELNVPIALAHVNHQLRGEESDADEAFVKALAAKWGVPFRSTRIALPSANVEAAARKARYEWFATLGVDWIATGHTADDQAETILLRILRGTGLQGLQGIHEEIVPSPPVATGGLSVIRPLLKITRSEVLEYLQDQPFRTDSSNSDLRFARNRIRHEVLPLLREFNPEIASVLGRLAEQATEVLAHISQNARALLQVIEKPRAGSTLIFDREALSKAATVIATEALRIAWRREGWSLDRMTHDDWTRLAKLEPGDYPGGVRLIVRGKAAQLGTTALPSAKPSGRG